jgi:hypothetical protein
MKRGPLLHQHLKALLAAALLLAAACGEQARSDRQLTAEEEILMARLTRDPGVVVVSWNRNPERFVEVITSQGRLQERYIFKPDRPGERALNIHHIDDTSRLDTGVSEYPGNGPVPNWTGRTR